MAPRFSIIIPVYNRPDEIQELLQSLADQSLRNFEVVIAEDGSTIPCKNVIDNFRDRLDITYLSRPNEGRSYARNHAMEASKGEWMVFFDSDCVIPPDYFATLSRHLDAHEGKDIRCYGGPDAAHPSFSRLQKAINFAMTSFLTTGGIRGGAKQLENFTPRTFNMGFSREVYEKVGGFREMFSEDIDMSRRIMAAGYHPVLLRSVPVYHKRRGSLAKFFRQVHIFGRSRITLYQLYPDSLKFVHVLPALALLIFIALLLLGIFCSPWWLLPIGIYGLSLFLTAIIVTRSLPTACLAVVASVIQIVGYGTGFIRAFFQSIIMRRGRNIDAEISARKGK